MNLRRLTAGLAIIGFVLTGWKVIPTLETVDAIVIFLALLHVVSYSLDGLITGEWPK